MAKRQRVTIGRAIVWELKAFLSDEPLSNVDAALRVNMRLEITELHQSLKTTMIYVTHDQVEGMTMAERIVVLRAGNAEQVGSPRDLYRAPNNLFIAGFIGSPQMNLTKGRMVSDPRCSAMLTVSIQSPATCEARICSGRTLIVVAPRFSASALTADPAKIHRFDADGTQCPDRVRMITGSEKKKRLE